MKKLYIVLFLITVTTLVYSQSRHYKPNSQSEENVYQIIDKNIWPNDVRENIEIYKNNLIGWTGIIEKAIVLDENGEDYWIIELFVRHHYYDWIEDFGIGNKPIRLSPDGEGYFICYSFISRNADIEKVTIETIGDFVINYGRPVMVKENAIILSTEYLRHISKVYVNTNWLNYYRNWEIRPSE